VPYWEEAELTLAAARNNQQRSLLYKARGSGLKLQPALIRFPSATRVASFIPDEVRADAALSMVVALKSGSKRRLGWTKKKTRAQRVLACCALQIEP